MTVDIAVVDAAGQPVADLVGLRAVRASAGSVSARAGAALRGPDDHQAGQHLFTLDWQVAPATLAPQLPVGPWLLIADAGGLGAAVADRLRLQGAACTVVSFAQELTRDAVRSLIEEHLPREIVYLRGLDIPADRPLAQENGLGGALAVTQGVLESSARLWVVTRGAQAANGVVTSPEQATLSGLGVAVATERAVGSCIRIDLDPTEPLVDGASALLQAMSAGDDEDLVAMRAGERLAARLVPIATTHLTGGATRLGSSSYGVLEGLHLVPMERRAPGAGEVEIEVAVTGLNFRDVLVALDLYPERSTVFGDECAGVVVRVGDSVDHLRVGDRVITLAPGSFATYVTTHADLACPIPDDLAFDDAATIPIPFLTAEYALVHARPSARRRACAHPCRGRRCRYGCDPGESAPRCRGTRHRRQPRQARRARGARRPARL